jgi:hypothetical protein
MYKYWKERDRDCAAEFLTARVPSRKVARVRPGIFVIFVIGQEAYLDIEIVLEDILCSPIAPYIYSMI